MNSALVLAVFAVLLFGGLSLLLWKPKAMSLGCGVMVFLGISLVISLVLLFAIPVLGFVIDAVYWLMVCFASMFYLLFLAARHTEPRQ